MIWLALLALAAATLAPLALLLSNRSSLRDRREAALALHRAQLTEIDRDLEEGRLAPTEHDAARLEVQRRLLHEAERTPPPARTQDRRPLLLATVLLVPAAALGLYLINGVPGMPAEPLAPRLRAAEQQTKQTDQLIAQLRARLAHLDPASPQSHQGYILLGNVEAERQDWAAAAQAWDTALEAQWDPALAMETAEAMYERDGHMTPETRGLFQRALHDAPPDAPWRAMVQKRLGLEAK